MVKLNPKVPENYNRSLRNRTIESENHVQKKVKKRRGRPLKHQRVIVERSSEPEPGVPNANEQLVLSLKFNYNQSQEIVKPKGRPKGLKPMHFIVTSTGGGGVRVYAPLLEISSTPEKLLLRSLGVYNKSVF